MAHDTDQTLLRKPFIFVRHGETDWNRLQLCVGQADRPLTDAGRAQAYGLADRVEGADVSIVYHSPLDRARSTALILAQALGCPTTEERGLVEASLGLKEGMPENDPEDPFIERWLQGARVADAEPYPAFRRRIVNAVNRCLKAPTGGLPMLVAHWGAHHALSLTAGVDIIDLEHCAARLFEPSGIGWSARMF